MGVGQGHFSLGTQPQDPHFLSSEGPGVLSDAASPLLYLFKYCCVPLFEVGVPASGAPRGPREIPLSGKAGWKAESTFFEENTAESPIFRRRRQNRVPWSHR